MYLSSKSPTFSHLTSGIFFTHAVNTPLTNLSINLDQALALLATKPHTQQEHQIIYQALLLAKHLRSLMLQRSSTKSRVGKFIVKAAIQEVVIRLQQPPRRSIISALFIDDDTRLFGDAYYFQEALSCVITNAFQASRKRRTKVVITTFTLRDKLTIYVSDAGPGMDWLTMRLATIKGFTNRKQGTGYGLSFAKNVIEEYHHGKLQLISSADMGTLVIIQLPLKR